MLKSGERVKDLLPRPIYDFHIAKYGSADFSM